eukprot:12415443-Karenia_brevis.AAC.1
MSAQIGLLHVLILSVMSSFNSSALISDVGDSGTSPATKILYSVLCGMGIISVEIITRGGIDGVGCFTVGVCSCILKLGVVGELMLVVSEPGKWKPPFMFGLQDFELFEGLLRRGV